ARGVGARLAQQALLEALAGKVGVGDDDERAQPATSPSLRSMRRAAVTTWRRIARSAAARSPLASASTSSTCEAAWVRSPSASKRRAAPLRERLTRPRSCAAPPETEGALARRPR